MAMGTGMQHPALRLCLLRRPQRLHIMATVMDMQHPATMCHLLRDMQHRLTQPVMAMGIQHPVMKSCLLRVPQRLLIMDMAMDMLPQATQHHLPKDMQPHLIQLAMAMDTELRATRPNL